MQELELTSARVASIWWLIAWRALLGGGIIGFGLAVLIGEAGGWLGFAFAPVAIVGTVAAWLAGLAWGFLVVRMALQKRYQEFRLALVKNS
jgi:hypothetical protein